MDQASKGKQKQKNSIEPVNETNIPRTGSNEFPPPKKNKKKNGTDRLSEVQNEV